MLEQTGLRTRRGGAAAKLLLAEPSRGSLPLSSSLASFAGVGLSLSPSLASCVSAGSLARARDRQGRGISGWVELLAEGSLEVSQEIGAQEIAAVGGPGGAEVQPHGAARGADAGDGAEREQSEPSPRRLVPTASRLNA